MESCSNQKSVKQINIDFRFFKVATLCLDDSFEHSGKMIIPLLVQLSLRCFIIRESECHLSSKKHYYSTIGFMYSRYCMEDCTVYSTIQRGKIKMCY